MSRIVMEEKSEKVVHRHIVKDLNWKIQDFTELSQQGVERFFTVLVMGSELFWKMDLWYRINQKHREQALHKEL